MLAASLKRGASAGLAAGLAFGLFVVLVASPLVAFADDLGHAEHPADGGEHAGTHDAAVSETVTDATSVVAGVLWGTLLGGVVFGVGFYVLEPAIPGGGAAKHYLLAGAGFVTVSGAPWLALPPAPPGVESTLPIATRLALYGATSVAGALACLLAGYAYVRVRGRRGRVAGVLAAALPFALLATAAVLTPAAPRSGPLPSALAAGLTGTVVFGQVLLWTVLATVHLGLHRRSRSRRATDVAAPGRGDAGTAG